MNHLATLAKTTKFLAQDLLPATNKEFRFMDGRKENENRLPESQPKCSLGSRVNSVFRYSRLTSRNGDG